MPRAEGRTASQGRVERLGPGALASPALLDRHTQHWCLHDCLAGASYAPEHQTAADPLRRPFGARYARHPCSPRAERRGGATPAFPPGAVPSRLATTVPPGVPDVSQRLSYLSAKGRIDEIVAGRHLTPDTAVMLGADWSARAKLRSPLPRQPYEHDVPPFPCVMRDPSLDGNSRHAGRRTSVGARPVLPEMIDGNECPDPATRAWEG